MLVSLMAGKAEVKYDAELLSAAAVTRLIEELGFGATLMEDNAVANGKLDLTVSPHTLHSHRPLAPVRLTPMLSVRSLG